MLNKPTGVFPYNTFLDINDEVTLSFTLKNIVDNIIVKMCSIDGTSVFTDLIANNNSLTQFSYTLSDEQRELMSNGNEYYWGLNYWDNIEDVSEGQTLLLNYWSLTTDTIGFLPSDPIEDLGMEEVTYIGEYPLWDAQNSKSYDWLTISCPALTQAKAEYYRDNWKVIKNAVNDGAEYYLKFDTVVSGETLVYYAKVVSVSSFYTDGKNSEISVACDLFDRPSSDFEGAIPELFNFSDEVNIGQYIQLSYDDEKYVYKVNSTNIDVIDKTPTVALSLDGALPSFVTYETAYSDITAIAFETVEYNASPPYYFYCEEYPVIKFKSPPTAMMFSPSFTICAYTTKNLDINIYQYELYEINNGIYDLVWSSSELHGITKTTDASLGEVYEFDSVVYHGVSAKKAFEVRINGTTSKGMDFEKSKSFLISGMGNAEYMIFAIYNDNYGAVVIDSRNFTVPSTDYALEIYKQDTTLKQTFYVGSLDYADSVENDEGLLVKESLIYDYNIISNTKYVYYAFYIKNGVCESIVQQHITIPQWDKMYLTDISYITEASYIPSKDSFWTIDLNYESSTMERNYQVSHPIGINQKYPKSIRGASNFRTGSVSGLLGSISCGDRCYLLEANQDYLLDDTNSYLTIYNEDKRKYVENRKTLEAFEKFCSNGNLKLLRGGFMGEYLIVDIDSMNTSIFSPVATTVNIDYTQIDSVDRKQISLEW